MGGIAKPLAKFDKTLQKVSPAAKIKAVTEKKTQRALFGKEEDRNPLTDLFSTTASNLHEKLTTEPEYQKRQRVAQQTQTSNYGKSLLTS